MSLRGIRNTTIKYVIYTRGNNYSTAIKILEKAFLVVSNELYWPELYKTGFMIQCHLTAVVTTIATKTVNFCNVQ